MPGPSRPFNFFGVLDQKDMDELRDGINQSRNQKSNHTIVYAHYPLLTLTSSLSSSGESFSDLSQFFSVYLCGHLHTLLGSFSFFLLATPPLFFCLQ